MNNKPIQRRLKRVLDITFSLSALTLALPLICLIGLSLFLTVGRPIFFRQRRPGYLGSPFWVLKFRTMSNDRDNYGRLLPDDERLTKIGRLLRALSIDELPQLLNVLRGEMSLVGPRPLLMEYMKLYTPIEKRRHDVLPGITGWAQINGRNALTWKKKFELDVWYVENWGLALDVKILLLTIIAVISRKGVRKQGHATTEVYNGSN
jgi:sugar transferase EpsL